MQLFLDTTDINILKDLAATGLVDGVTTNPTLIAKSGRPMLQVIAEICDAVEGPVSAILPGSAVQLHEHVTVVVDEAAASQLKLADYYRYTFDNKPAWQGI